MNAHLEQRLRDSVSTDSVTRPVNAILERGDRLRRRRIRAVTAGIGTALAAAALAATVVLPPSSSPIPTPAVAAWSGGDTNLSPQELDALSDACLSGQNESPPAMLEWPEGPIIPKDTAPLAAESRDGTVLAYYRYEEFEATCLARQEPDGSISSAGLGLSDGAGPLPAGSHLGTIGFGYSDPGRMGGPVTNLSTVAQVSAEVDRVTADIADEEIEGSVTNGVVLFWVTGTFTVQQVDEAVFTAFDADGDVIDASPR